MREPMSSTTSSGSTSPSDATALPEILRRSSPSDAIFNGSKYLGNSERFRQIFATKGFKNHEFFSAFSQNPYSTGNLLRYAIPQTERFTPWAGSTRENLQNPACSDRTIHE